MHEDSMKKLQDYCVSSWLVFLAGAAQLLLAWVCVEGICLTVSFATSPTKANH